MPRYIDADELIAKLNYSTQETWGKGLGRDWWSHSVKLKDNIVRVINDMPNADVVPRSEVEKAKQEVASDIFDKLLSHTSVGIRWLKDLINETECEEDKTHLKGRLAELCNTETVVRELKKKYIGE